MNFFKKILKLSGTGFTNGQYYESMNLALKRLNNEHTMLHYPFYVNDNDSFIQAQKNLTDYCISKISPLNKKDVLEIGCGNGVQSIYIYRTYQPQTITGIDLNKANIDIAKSEISSEETAYIRFMVDDAQKLSQIKSDSVDTLINIESAFHYPDKTSFINEVHRVLKPGGEFLIADLLTNRERREGIMKLWGKPMDHHFWHKNRYFDEFRKSDLVLNKSEDISAQVRKGWAMYRNWLPAIKRKGFLMNIAFRIFYVINSRMNMHFLNNRQHYYIFTGHKPI